MQRSGSMAQPTNTCEPVGASLRSLSDTQPVSRSSSTCLGGKYTFLKKIELYKGSVSTVYKCLMPGGNPVVVKTYHKAKMVEKHFHKLEREVAAMRAMSRKVGKKGIVELLDTYEDANAVYLVMECCEGGDLFKRLMLHGGKLPEHWVCVQVIAPLLRVLARMHELHIMHRDIKPENLFLTAEGEVKLGDFGLAIEWTRELPFSRSGTLDYMAPEVLMNPATHTQESSAVTPTVLASKGIRPYTAAVDVWAVGCLAYELVCGRPPFEVEDEKQTANLIIHSNNIAFDPPGTANWAHFVTEALTKDPRRRPDATELLDHPWIRSNLERAEREAAAAAACTRAPAAAAPMRRDSGRPAVAEVASMGPVVYSTASASQKTMPVSVGGSSVAASDCGISCGGSSVASGSSMGGGSYTSGVSTGGSSTISAASACTTTQACASSPSPSPAVQALLTAATNLALRVQSQQQQQQQQHHPGSMTPPPGGSASAATAPNTTAAVSVAAPASVPPQQRAPSPSSTTTRSRASTQQGGNTAALRSLLDQFKSASINGNTSAAAAGSERRVPSAAAVRAPSAGSILSSPPGASTAAGAGALSTMGWRTPPASPTRDRCCASGGAPPAAGELPSPSSRVSPQRAAPSAGPCMGSSANSGSGNSGSLSPSRMPRIGGVASTGGMAGSGASGSGGTSVLSSFMRPLTSISTAGGCAGSFTSAAEASSSSAAVPSGAYTSSAGSKPPRPRSESPVQLIAAAAAAVSASSNTYASSPLRNTSHPASPPRRQPSMSTTPRKDWGQGGLPTSAALQDLTRNWGAVASVNVNKPGVVSGTGAASCGANISAREGSFSSPQRHAGGLGGKGMDSYGMPPATPVASALPPSEYCSPRPVGVLERVKCHLRGGGSAVPVGGVAPSGGQQGQQ
ncbi:hypothetical protein Agub_g1920 [Astrephomene gubernaculifera]|uniref:Protein kinase domain-containing protein n=1 Tax=Astrephomene gubernaculifera TaxID=47775 RepID=A0AAD3DG91_9CHLO|nr:hypothetical protein Agub_g1920 [Astrephomene gubernaculifera]